MCLDVALLDQAFDDCGSDEFALADAERLHGLRDGVG
jgi:hypothetical protein